MEVPQDKDWLSAAPLWYKAYVDSTKDGTEWMKTIIEANYPAITSIQVFHESKSDLGGNMIARFMYDGKNIDLPISYQSKMDTLTKTENQYLSAHIQSMNPETRGLFNSILNYVAKLEKWKTAIKSKTHAALADINPEIQSA